MHVTAILNVRLKLNLEVRWRLDKSNYLFIVSMNVIDEFIDRYLATGNFKQSSPWSSIS